MAVSDLSIFTADRDAITRDTVAAFLQQQAAERLFLEGTTVEFKRERSGHNVVEAVCALANTEGGIVFVGIDETRPDRMPGVHREEHDKLVRQCMALLEPRYAPDITVVAGEDADCVVLVVRVLPEDVPPPPVLCAGRAYLRAPGQTVRANRDQLMALVDRGRAAIGLAGSALVSSSDFYPFPRTGGPDDAGIPDLRLRAVGGVWLRPTAAQRIIVGTPLRRRLERLVDGSSLARWAAGGADAPQQHPWSPVEGQHNVWHATQRVARAFPPAVTLGLNIRVQGHHVGYYVDVEIVDTRASQPDDARPTTNVLSLADALEGVVRLLSLASRLIPDTLIDEISIPPTRYDAMTVWLMPGAQDLYRVLGLDDYPHDVTNRRATAGQFTAVRGDADSDHAATLAWLQKILLDDGVHGAEDIAAALIAGVTHVDE